MLQFQQLKIECLQLCQEGENKVVTVTSVRTPQAAVYMDAQALLHCNPVQHLPQSHTHAGSLEPFDRFPMFSDSMSFCLYCQGRQSNSGGWKIHKGIKAGVFHGGQKDEVSRETESLEGPCGEPLGPHDWEHGGCLNI
jgi:hypothetical protein